MPFESLEERNGTPDRLLSSTGPDRSGNLALPPGPEDDATGRKSLRSSIVGICDRPHSLPAFAAIDGALVATFQAKLQLVKLGQLKFCLKRSDECSVNSSKSRQRVRAIANADDRRPKGLTAGGIVFWARW